MAKKQASKPKQKKAPGKKKTLPVKKNKALVPEIIESDGLTAKQRIFCHEYIIDWNATRAARVAGYSESSARTIGCDNLTKPYITAYIDLIKNDIEKQAGISKLMVVNEHKKLAFSSIAHLHETWIDRRSLESLSKEQKDSIQEIETRVVKREVESNSTAEPIVLEVEQIKIKLYDKQKALEQLAKIMGYNPETSDRSKIPDSDTPLQVIQNQINNYIKD